MKKNINFFIVLFMLNTLSTNSQGLRALGKKIVNKNGKEVLLKGIGLGGWMLQEGYMMNSSGAADTQHEFIEKLNDLIGEEETNTFYTNWRKNFIQKRDIDSIAKWGYNSVRLAMHYNLFTKPIEDEPVAGENTWLTTGFEMVDELLSWCEENQIYLILDLHAAPGGQGQDAAISDYDSDKPSLWESDLNKSKTVALWGKLAERYKDKEWIGGYDLINEINWPIDGSVIRDLYVRITNAIRAHDANHIIYIEGNWFANDFSGLTPPWDSNLVYSFHKYWTYNDTASIQWVLDLRNQHNVPLWMGESGENSNVWYTEAVKLFETNNIGWSWWPWKRIETTVSPFSVKSNQNYEAIINYWKGEGPRPSSSDAISGLSQLTTDLLVENNDYFKDVVDAVLRQPSSDTHIPYAENNIPGVLYLSNYDLGTNQVAYSDTDYANYSLSTNSFQAWNAGWALRNDGVDIQTNSDNTNSNGYHIGYTEVGEWLKYTLNVAETGFYNFNFRYATEQSGAKVNFLMNDVDITGNVSIGNTGSWSNFVNQFIENVYLEQGTHVFTVKVKAGSFNMSSIAFEKSNNNITDFKVLSAKTIDDEKSIKIVLNQPATDVNLTIEDFKVKVNDIEVGIKAVKLDPASLRFVVLELDDYLYYQDALKVSYTGDDLQSENNIKLPIFNNYTIENTLVQRAFIPNKIQAEDFHIQIGLETENTSDNGAGQNIGFTDPGDYATYKVFVSKDGNYTLDLRTAAENTEGEIAFELSTEKSLETLVNVNLPITGGWQSWQTTSTDVALRKGIYTLKMKVVKSGFNLNWFEFKFASNLSVPQIYKEKLTIYPNPLADYFQLKTSDQILVLNIKLIDVSGRIIKSLNPVLDKTVYNLSEIKAGIYFLVLETNKGILKKKLIKK
ncbi:carbohydrate-binding protein [Polaribacter sp.]|uniref:carbohydrate-binding protein n=1 Tax=Polaribacter sp. TaxID=1920175 RepID=UPI003F6C3530